MTGSVVGCGQPMYGAGDTADTADTADSGDDTGEAGDE
jgi:hypothetical protein